MKPLRILLTGANGFIGYHLCKKLLTLNNNVVALIYSEKSQKLKNLLNDKKLSIIRGDIKDSEFTSELFRQNPVDVVFHLAVAPPLQQDLSEAIPLEDSTTFKTNFNGTLNLLKFATNEGTAAWIQSSTMSVYNYESADYIPIDEKHQTNPKDIYGLSKLLAEEACQYYSNYDLKTIILRYSGVFGTGKSGGLIAEFTKKCLKNSGKQFTAAVGRTSDFIFVDDVVNANILAMNKLLNTDPMNPGDQFSKSNFEIYNIGSGEEISACSAVNLIRELCRNESVKIIEEEGKSRRFFFDISLAKKQLKFSPGTLRQGLTKYIDQIKKQL